MRCRLMPSVNLCSTKDDSPPKLLASNKVVHGRVVRPEATFTTRGEKTAAPQMTSGASHTDPLRFQHFTKSCINILIHKHFSFLNQMCNLQLVWNLPF